MNPSDSYDVRTPEQDSPLAGEGGSRIWGIMKGTAKFASREFERFIDTMGFNTVTDNSSSQLASPLGLSSEARSSGQNARVRDRSRSIQQATTALHDVMNQVKELEHTRHATTHLPPPHQQSQQRPSNNEPLCSAAYSSSAPRTPLQNRPDHADDDDRIKLLERRIEMLQGVVDKLVGPDKIERAERIDRIDRLERADKADKADKAEPTRALSRSAARLATPSPDLSPRPEETLSRRTRRSPSPQPLSIPLPAAPSPEPPSASPRKISTLTYSARETPRTPPPRRSLSPLRQRTPLRASKPARPSQSIRVMPFVEELNRALSKKASPPALTPRPVGAPKLTHIPSQHYDVQQEINEMIPKVQLRRTEMIPGPDGTLQRNKVWTEIYDRKQLYRYKRSHASVDESPSERGSSEPSDKRPRPS